MRKCILICLIGAVAALGYFFREQIFSTTHQVEHNKPDPERYEALKTDLAELRKEFAYSYQSSEGDETRQLVLEDTRKLLETVLPEMMRCWLGTPWDFNGISETPGEGNIACGYFVSTILRDAGFSVSRIKLAQQPSQHILHTFVSPDTTTRLVGKSYQTFLDDLALRPSGIYIVGLDTHVGFILNQPENKENPLRFIHSSGAWPAKKVVDESAQQAKVLKTSNYRIYGNVTTSPESLDKWLMGASFEIASR